MSITNFDEARQRLNELTAGMHDLLAFLNFADNAIGSVNSLKGKPTPAPAVADIVVVRPPPNGQHVDMPESMADRVLEIFRRAGKPLSPKEAVSNYIATGWVIPNERKLYPAIMGGIAYLVKRRGLLEKTESGYRLKPAE